MYDALRHGLKILITKETSTPQTNKITIHSRSQSSRGKKGTTAMSWRQRKYQDNPLPYIMLGTVIDFRLTHEEYAGVIKAQSVHSK